MEEYSVILRDWYATHKRDLPWRHTRDPYRIWISEVVLQQTQVQQGQNYYLRLTSAFPDIKSLANASIEEVMKLWQGLGYYNRAINMKRTAEYLMAHRNGVFPTDYKEIVQLKGIGPYIAAAIVSFAFEQPYPVVDGNVKRVISRLFSVGVTHDAKFEKDILEKAREILDPDQPGLHNQAIMEFGALQCVPVNPMCQVCVFINHCAAYRDGMVKMFPPRKKKSQITKRFLHFFVFQSGHRVLIHQRSQNDIWPQLFDFPTVETRNRSSAATVRKMLQDQYQLSDNETVFDQVSRPYIHKLSHQTIHARFYIINHIPNNVKKTPDIQMIATRNLKDHGFPRLISHFLDAHFNLKE